MYGLKVYITPDDIIDRLSPIDKQRFNQCIFTDISKESDGSITIECVLFNDPDNVRMSTISERQRYPFNDIFPNGYNSLPQQVLKLIYEGDTEKELR